MKKHHPRRKLHVEQLEDRSLLAVVSDVSGDVLRLISDRPADPVNEFVSLDVDPAAGTLLVRGTDMATQQYQLTALNKVNVDLGAGRDFYQLGVRDEAGTDAVMAQLDKMSFGAWLKDGDDRAMLDIRSTAVKNISVDGGEGVQDRLDVLELAPAKLEHPNFEIENGVQSSPRAGWASDTGFRNAETSVQRNIVSNALAAVGQLSGQSQLFGAADGQGTPWVTDATGDDGDSMRDAINVYDDWFVSARDRGTVPQYVRDEMVSALGQTYSQSDKDSLVNRIIEQYNRLAPQGPVTVPGENDDNATLQFLGIQKQCIEWNSTIAIASGGQARGYTTNGVTVTNTADYRPGMALLRGNTHAMLITDIEWDSAGNPIRFRVAEANAGDDVWSNPVGEVPWDRHVRLNVLEASTAGLRVIRME